MKLSACAISTESPTGSTCARQKKVELKAGEFKLIHLGVAMQLPEGLQAHIVPKQHLSRLRYYPDKPLRYHRRELLRTERLVLHAGVCPARHRDSCQ